MIARNGYAKRVRSYAKGPYKKTDVDWWHNQGKTLIEKTSVAGANKWKWIRFLK